MIRVLFGIRPNKMNEKLAKVFDQLAIQFKKERYRSRAYRNAAAAIRSHQGTILSGTEAQKNIKGIGKSIAAKIDEILISGTLELIENRPPEEKLKDQTIELFEGIHGVGPVTAEKWYMLGFRTINDLSAHYHQMTASQKLGYYYYHQLKRRISRNEMDMLAEVINKSLNEYQILICGSYRRGESSSGDIDCLIKASSDITMGMVVKKLEESGIIIGQLALGSAKYMGICKLNETYNARRIDLMIVAEESWPYATLYFTGSKKLNVIMRSKALEMGMSMNEYGIDTLTMDTLTMDEQIKTERDIFKLLEMEYIEPTQRSL